MTSLPTQTRDSGRIKRRENSSQCTGDRLNGACIDHTSGSPIQGVQRSGSNRGVVQGHRLITKTTERARSVGVIRRLNISSSTSDRLHAVGIHHTTGFAIQRVQVDCSNFSIGNPYGLIAETNDGSGSVGVVHSLHICQNTGDGERRGRHINRKSGQAVDQQKIGSCRLSVGVWLNRNCVSVIAGRKGCEIRCGIGDRSGNHTRSVGIKECRICNQNRGCNRDRSSTQTTDLRINHLRSINRKNLIACTSDGGHAAGIDHAAGCGIQGDQSSGIRDRGVAQRDRLITKTTERARRVGVIRRLNISNSTGDRPHTAGIHHTGGFTIQCVQRGGSDLGVVQRHRFIAQIADLTSSVRGISRLHSRSSTRDRRHAGGIHHTGGFAIQRVQIGCSDRGVAQRHRFIA